MAAALYCTPVPTSENGVQVIPNPVHSSFYLKIESGEISNLQLVIVNALGQTMYTKQMAKPAGISVISIPAVNLTPGAYYLVLFNGNKRFAAKPFIKL